MKLRGLILAFSLILAGATNAATIQPVTKFSLPNVAAMKNQNLASKPSLTLDGYYTAGDGGGGDFSYFAGACTDDGGYIIKDGASNCFKRIKVTGDVRQFGVTTGSAYDWVTHHTSTTDITPVLTAMGTALALAGVNTIDLSGVSVYMKTDYAIPSNFEFTCDAVVGPAENVGWYDDEPGAIYKPATVLFHRAGRGTSLHDCFILSDDIVAANTPINAATTRAALDRMVAGNGTGAVCDSQGCNDAFLFITGFDTGYELNGGSESVLENTYVDADVCYWVHQTGGAPRWANNQCFTYLTKNSPQKKLRYNITKIESGAGGVCHVTVTPQDVGTGPGQETLADLASAKYLYTTALADGPSACEGRHTITNLDTVAGTFDLVGTVVAGPSPWCHWAAGTKIVYCSDETNIANGESVTTLAGSGIPNPTKVEILWRLPPQTSGYIQDTGGAANTYVANDAPALQPCTLGDGLNVAFTAAHTNTAASTLNITLNSGTGCTGGTTGAIAIVHQDGSALIANDIISGKSVLVRYNLALAKWIIIQAKVVLDTATTAAQAANIQVPFAGAVCTGGACGAAPEADVVFSARVDAGASDGGVAAGGTGWATGFMIGGPAEKQLPLTDRVAGFQATDPGSFDHMVEYHIENSNESGISNLATDSSGFDDDPNPVILLVDGESNNAHIHGRKAGKGGRSIIVNVAVPDDPNRGAVTWTGASVAATTGFLPVTTVEQGCFRMLSGITNTGGANLVSNFANCARYDVYMPNVTTYAEGAAALAVLDTTGSTLEAGQNYPSAGAGLQTNTVTNKLETTGGQAKAVTAATTYTLLPTDCGAVVPGSAISLSTYTLPLLPPPGCEFKFAPGLLGILLKFNGKVAFLPGDGAHSTTSRKLPFFKENGYFTLTYTAPAPAGDDQWYPSSTSRLLFEQIGPLDDQQLVHGQNLFAYDGSQFFTLTPLNGPGGLLITDQMHNLPSLKFDKAGTTNSTANNFFVGQLMNTVSATASDAGAIKATLGTALTGANVGDTVHLNCFSGTSGEIDGERTGIITTDLSHVTLTGSTWVATETANCRMEYIVADTGAHAVSARGVDVNSGTVGGAFTVGTASFVGAADIGAAHAVNSTNSLFNYDYHRARSTPLASGDFVLGTGAGTSPIFTSVVGTDNRFRLSFTTGTTPAATAIIFTLTFKAAFGSAPFCFVAGENSASGQKISSVSLAPGTTTLVFNSGTVGLVAATAYVFTFQCT